MIIDTADLDPTSSYKLLIGSVLPRAIAWVSTSSRHRSGQHRARVVLHRRGQDSADPVDLTATAIRRRHPQGHLRQHPRHERVRRQPRHHRARPTRCTSRHSNSTPASTNSRRLGLEKAAVGGDLGAHASPVRRSHSNASSTASSRCRRCPTTSCGERSSASTYATISTCPGDASTSARWVYSAGSQPSTHSSTTSSPPRCPTISSSELSVQRADRLDGHSSDYSPIDTAEWSASGSTKAAAK